MTNICKCPIGDNGPPMPSFCGASMMLMMGMLETLVNNQCDLADPCNRIMDRGDKLHKTYDFVVVGGGTPGSVVASRLSENPKWKVLMLEAGGDEPTPARVPAWHMAYQGQPDTDWNYRSVRQSKACLANHGICKSSRGKMLGGTSAMNDMMYMRGHEADYNEWAEMGAKGWAFKDVKPYFMKSEGNKEVGSVVSHKDHGVKGPMPVRRFRHTPQIMKDLVKSASELGYPHTNDLNTGNATGFAIGQAYNDHGSRYSSSRGYLRPAAHRHNLHVGLHSMVTGVNMDSNKTVKSVSFMRKGKKHTVGVNKEAILTGGAMSSPQLLMLSGIGPVDMLSSLDIPVVMDLPGVGQDLVDDVGSTLDFTVTDVLDMPELNVGSVLDYLTKREGPMAATGLLQGLGLVNSSMARKAGRPDLQFRFHGYNAACYGPSMGNMGLNMKKMKKHVRISPMVLKPRSKGHVTLKSKNPLDPPVIQPNYFHDEHDLHAVMEGSRMAYRLANTEMMREKYGMHPTEGYASKCGNSMAPTDAFFKCVAQQYTETGNNQAGTCKMGSAMDKMSVVDHELKVHGVKGLRIMDASVMPTLPVGNIQGPVMMIAERGSDLIKMAHKHDKDTDSHNNQHPSDIK